MHAQRVHYASVDQVLLPWPKKQLEDALRRMVPPVHGTFSWKLAPLDLICSRCLAMLRRGGLGASDNDRMSVCALCRTLQLPGLAIPATPTQHISLERP